MLLAFKTEYTTPLNYALKDFEEPPGTVSRIVHLWLYTTTKVHTFNDGLIIIETQSFIELACKYAIYMLGATYILGFLLNLPSMMWVTLPFIILILIINNPQLHTRMFIKQVRKYGHDKKIKIVNQFIARVRLRNASNNDKTTNV